MHEEAFLETSDVATQVKSIRGGKRTHVLRKKEILKGGILGAKGLCEDGDSGMKGKRVVGGLMEVKGV